MAAERLAAVLEQENAALRAMDLRRAVALLPEKTAATADLTASAAAAFGPPGASLVATVRRLDSLASENRRLLRRAIRVQQRVIGIVVRAAAAAMVQPAYGATRRQDRLTGPIALSTRA